jgi:glycosyltransferase involved in cell wall biosynthesis
MNEKISVIIPLFNKGPYIARAIQSVLHQTWQNFDIIIVDGGSRDEGPDKVKEFHDPRIYFLEQTGKGVSNARNEGVNFSKNEYIAFLDADDEWTPNHIATILRLIDNYPDAGIYTTACKIRMNNGETRWMKYDYIPNAPFEGILPNYFQSGCIGDFPVQTSSAVIPRKIFHEVGGFPEGYWWGEDADLFGKIALRYPVAFSWEQGAIYCRDDTNRASNRMRPLDYEEPFVKTARAALKSGEVPPEFNGPLNEYIAKTEIMRAILNVRAGHSAAAREILKHCPKRAFFHERLKWMILAHIPNPIFQKVTRLHSRFH